MPNHSEIIADFRITTPCFIGDAEQQARAINGPTVKGALRYWWRALYWHTVLQQHADPAQALVALHAEEAEVFGHAADEGGRDKRRKAGRGYGQSRVLLRVDAGGLKPAARDKPGCGIQYLMGRGLYHYNDGYRRGALAPGGFTLRCRTRDLAPHQQQALLQALVTLGTLGGLGSRARKGFGALSIQSLRLDGEAQTIPTDATALRDHYDRLPRAAGLPPFTALSEHSRVDISAVGGAPGELLERAGRELQLYRSWGRHNKVCSQPAEQNFRNDHDLMLAIGGGRNPSGIPDRTVFGLPHNYFFSSTRAKVDYAPGQKDRTRRASPLFIHPHQFPDGRAVLVQALLPAQFLPAGDPLVLKPGRGKPQTRRFGQGGIDVRWQVIGDYLDRFQNRQD